MSTVSSNFPGDYSKHEPLLQPNKFIGLKWLNTIKDIYDNCSARRCDMSKNIHLLESLPLNCMKPLCRYFNGLKNGASDCLIGKEDSVETSSQIMGINTERLLSAIIKIAYEQLVLLSADNALNPNRNDNISN